MKSRQKKRLISETSVETLESQLKQLRDMPIFNFTFFNELIDQYSSQVNSEDSGQRILPLSVNWIKKQKSLLRELLEIKSKEYVEDFLKRELLSKARTGLRDSGKQSFVYMVASKFLDEESPLHQNKPGKSTFFLKNDGKAILPEKSKKVNTEGAEDLNSDDPTFGENNFRVILSPKKGASKPLFKEGAMPPSSRRNGSRGEQSSMQLIDNSLNENLLPEMFLVSSKNPSNERVSIPKVEPVNPSQDKQIFYKRPNLTLSNTKISTSKCLFPRTPQQLSKEKLFVTWMLFEKEVLRSPDLCNFTKGSLSRQFILQINWMGQKIMLEDFETRESVLIKERLQRDKELGLARQKLKFEREEKRGLREEIQRHKERGARQQGEVDSLIDKLNRLKREKLANLQVETRLKSEATQDQKDREKLEFENRQLLAELEKLEREFEEQRERQVSEVHGQRDLVEKINELEMGLRRAEKQLDIERREKKIIEEELESKIGILLENNDAQIRGQEELMRKNKERVSEFSRQVSELKFRLSRRESEGVFYQSRVEQLQGDLREARAAYDKVKCIMKNFKKGFHYYREKSNQRDKDGPGDPCFDFPKGHSTRHSLSHLEQSRGNLAQSSNEFFTLRDKKSPHPFQYRSSQNEIMMKKKNRLIHERGVKLKSLLELKGLSQGSRRNQFLNKLDDKAKSKKFAEPFGCEEGGRLKKGRSYSLSQSNHSLPGEEYYEEAFRQKCESRVLKEQKSADLTQPRQSLESMHTTSSQQMVMPFDSVCIQTSSVNPSSAKPNHRESMASSKKDLSNLKFIESESHNRQFSTTLENNSHRPRPTLNSTLDNERLKSSNFYRMPETFDPNELKTQKEIESENVFSQRNFKKVKSHSYRSANTQSAQDSGVGKQGHFTFQLNKNSLFAGNLKQPFAKSTKHKDKYKKGPSRINHRNYFLRNRHSIGGLRQIYTREKLNKHNYVNYKQRAKENLVRRQRTEGSIKSSTRSAFSSKKRRNLMRLVNTNQRRFIDRMQKKYQPNISGEMEISINRDSFINIKKNGHKNSFNIKFEIG